MTEAAPIEIRKTAAPLRRQVLDGLRQAIITGTLKPGQRLTERELITMMAVSRTVIREALRQLESEGLIEIVPNKGPVVRELSAEEARDLYRIRAVLEGLAGRLFVENGSDEDLAALERALDVVEGAYERGDADEVIATKSRFYDVLNSGAKSETLGVMLGTLHARIARWRALGISHPQRSSTRSRQSLDNLRQVLQAIRARDTEEAERLMRFETGQAAAEVERLLAADGRA